MKPSAAERTLPLFECPFRVGDIVTWRSGDHVYRARVDGVVGEHLRLSHVRARWLPSAKWLPLKESRDRLPWRYCERVEEER